jgi:hypothetical protein
VNRVTSLAAMLGCAFLIWGAALVYRPLGYISTGALLLGAALIAARHK